MKVELFYKDIKYTKECDEDEVYNYTDGNYSCDCNRGLFIGEDLDCNDRNENKIKIKIYDDEDLIYNELD